MMIMTRAFIIVVRDYLLIYYVRTVQQPKPSQIHDFCRSLHSSRVIISSLLHWKKTLVIIYNCYIVTVYFVIVTRKPNDDIHLCKSIVAHDDHHHHHYHHRHAIVENRECMSESQRVSHRVEVSIELFNWRRMRA